MKIKHLLITLFTAAFFLSACQKSAVDPAFNNLASGQLSAGNLTKSLAITQTFDEGFESGSKTAYADGTVTFTSGSWDLNDAWLAQAVPTLNWAPGLSASAIRAHWE
jgi:endonuclease G